MSILSEAQGVSYQESAQLVHEPNPMAHGLEATVVAEREAMAAVAEQVGIQSKAPLMATGERNLRHTNWGC